jgi:metacaspase-1
MVKLLLILLLSCQLLWAEKKALLVAVGAYPTTSGWQSLHAENDVLLLSKTLLAKGFSSENISILQNEKATKSQIINALNTLLASTNQGDVVYFHFSGHGQQVKDSDADEIDGYDEAIVPFNSPKHYQSGIYEGENLIRDDELNLIFQKIRLKIGQNGQLIATFDACHSGTATRGFKTARGTDEKMADDAYQKSWTDSKTTATSTFEEYNNTQNNELSPYIGIFSSGSNQLSYEEHLPEGDCGIFTYFLAKNLLNASKLATYQSLFEKIKIDFVEHNAQQIPEIEGKTPLPIFGENQVATNNGIPVSEWLQSQNLGISAGTLLGLNDGCIVEIYDAQQKKLARGTLEEVTAFHAEVTLESPLTKNQALGAYAKVIYTPFKSNSIKLKSDEKSIGKLPQFADIEWVEHNFDLYLKNQEDRTLALLSNDGSLIKTFSSVENVSQQLLNILSKWRKSQILRQLNMSHQDLKASLFFRDEKTGKVENTVKIGAKLRLEIQNDGDIPFYFNIIDISSNQELSLIIPFERPASEFYLKPKQHYTSDFVIQVSEPTGNELLKLIATSEPIDLSSLNGTQNKGIGSPKNPLEKIIGQSFFGNTKSTASIQMSDNDALVKTFILTIEK